jgi:hypothetical protein
MQPLLLLLQRLLYMSWLQLNPVLLVLRLCHVSSRLPVTCCPQ